MGRIDYYFATISPYTYLAGLRLEEIADRHGLSIDYKPVDLLALFGRTGGVPPKARHPARQEYRAQELVRWAEALNMPFNLQPAHFPTDLVPSSLAFLTAGRSGGGDLGALAHGLTRACWAEDRDVADPGVIRDCLVAAGFDAGLADTGHEASQAAFAANLDDAEANGVFGAPFYITPDGQRFWGQDRLDQLDAHLARRTA